MKEFVDAACSSAVTGFVVTLRMPFHPEDFEGCLTPKDVDGRYYKDWMYSLPGVLKVIGRWENCQEFLLLVDLDKATMGPEEFAQFVQDKVNAAGFQY